VDDSCFGVLVNMLYDCRQLLVPGGITRGAKRFSWTGFETLALTTIGGKTYHGGWSLQWKPIAVFLCQYNL
jgi:hypothetical protein